MTLTSRSHLSVREKRQGGKAKYADPKGKHIYENTPMAHRSNGRAGEVVACNAGRAGTVGPRSVWLYFKIGFPKVMIF
jgi:hypothetical protein